MSLAFPEALSWTVGDTFDQRARSCPLVTVCEGPTNGFDALMYLAFWVHTTHAAILHKTVI